MEIVAQVFGLTFVGIIMVCLIWTIMEFIFTDIHVGPSKRNKK